MPLSGDLKSISLVSLLQVIEAERKTGILTIDCGPFQKNIYFRDGAIIFLVSNEPRDFLGHFLVQNGIISEEILVKALQRQAQTKELIGQIIQSLVNISQEKISEQLRKKLEESFYQLFLLEEAEFTLKEESFPEENFPESFQLDSRCLLMEGMRRLDEYKKLKQNFPHIRQSFSVHREKIGPELREEGLVPQIIDCLEKGLCIDDLCMHFHAYEYSILLHLEPLEQKGIIQKAVVLPEAKPEKTDTPIEKLLQNAQEAEKKKEWIKALDFYQEILTIDPKNQEIRDCFNLIQEEYIKEITHEELPRRAILCQKKGVNLQKQKLSTLDGFILSRINDQWTVAEILTVVPSPEVNVLKCLKDLLERGIIEKK